VAYVSGAILFLIALVEIALAGGPQYVAGVSYFDNGLAGKPVTWANGAITYYTDLGNLSPLLAGRNPTPLWRMPSLAGRALTAAVSAARGGQLAEDVSGANVLFNADRTISMPIDIQPSATNKPVAIVYDADGAVTNALIGTGASTDCFTNATFGGIDAFTTDGHFAHALVILDGRCATTSNSLPDLEYRLVRVLGQIFGLGWSQLNVNAITGTPQPTADELAGLPVMHAQDLPSCVPISQCYPLADQPKMDDRRRWRGSIPSLMTISRMPGQAGCRESTGRIRGSVYFTDASGTRTQPMQGVNRGRTLDDPGTHQRPGRYAAASVSGYLFRATPGMRSPVSMTRRTYNSLDRTTPQEGFFDLGGLRFPAATAQYLSVEPLDPSVSWARRSIRPTTVQPRSMQAIIVTIGRAPTFSRTF
jgi:hypothetical protein